MTVQPVFDPSGICFSLTCLEQPLKDENFLPQSLQKYQVLMSPGTAGCCWPICHVNWSWSLKPLLHFSQV